MLNDKFTELKGEIGGPPDTPVISIKAKSTNLKI